MQDALPLPLARIAISASLFLAYSSSVLGDEKKEEEQFYSQLNRAVIRLESSEMVMRAGSSGFIKNTASQGTAFFVRIESKLYVVSARHVVDKDSDLFARVETLRMDDKSKEVVQLRLPKERWVFHEQGPTDDTHFVDVAAMPIAWIKDRSIKAFRYVPNEIEASATNQISFADPVPPTRVLFLGFPGDIGFHLEEQRPFARSGIVAMTTGRKFLKLSLQGQSKYAEESAFIVDAEAFPGNSGSPLLADRIFADKVELMGLVTASNTSMDYTVCEPASRIREVLELARGRKGQAPYEFWRTIPKANSKSDEKGSAPEQGERLENAPNASN